MAGNYTGRWSRGFFFYFSFIIGTAFPAHNSLFSWLSICKDWSWFLFDVRSLWGQTMITCMITHDLELHVWSHMSTMWEIWSYMSTTWDIWSIMSTTWDMIIHVYHLRDMIIYVYHFRTTVISYISTTSELWSYSHVVAILEAEVNNHGWIGYA